jgi:uncharacterized glyoxalase superfamily protein PhnB
MTVQRVTPILNVSDVPASIRWFQSLGWSCGFTWNDGGLMGGALHNACGPAQFGSVCTKDAEIFLCHDGQGSRDGRLPHQTGDDDTGGVWMSWWLESPAEVDEMHARAVSLGMTITHPPTDEPWNVREFQLKHPDGHTFRVSAGLG